MMRRNQQAAMRSTALALSRAAALSRVGGAFGGDDQRTGRARDERSITAVYCFGVRRD